MKSLGYKKTRAKKVLKQHSHKPPNTYEYFSYIILICEKDLFLWSNILKNFMIH